MAFLYPKSSYKITPSINNIPPSLQLDKDLYPSSYLPTIIKYIKEDYNELLYVCCLANDFNNVKLLLDNGANPNGTPEKRPLFVAVRHSSPFIFNLLIERGANVKVMAYCDKELNYSPYPIDILQFASAQTIINGPLAISIYSYLEQEFKK